MTKLTPLLLAVWTSMVFVSLFIVQNPFLPQIWTHDNWLLIASIALTIYMLGVVMLLFIGRHLLRRSRRAYLRKLGLSFREYFRNPLFHVNDNGWDIVIDRHRGMIALFNINRLHVFDLDDFNNFYVQVEHGWPRANHPIIFFNWLLGPYGAVVVRVRVANQLQARKQIKKLQGIVPQAILNKAEHDLTRGIRAAMGEKVSPDAPIIDPLDYPRRSSALGDSIRDDNGGDLVAERMREQQVERKHMAHEEEMRRLQEAEQQERERMENERMEHAVRNLSRQKPQDTSLAERTENHEPGRQDFSRQPSSQWTAPHRNQPDDT